MNNATKQTAPSHIAAAVEPLRAAAVARAVTRAREIAEHVLARYAARPESFEVPVLTFTNKPEVTIARRNQATLYAVTIAGEAPPAVRLPWEPKLAAPRVRSEAGIEHFAAQAGENASAEYTAFIAKLEQKIGACDSAELTGDHVWGHSTLTVSKGAERETWITHQIINVSKLGTVFNQWPTRKAPARRRR